jgi:probable HAF family extracellular repeat protein
MTTTRGNDMAAPHRSKPLFCLTPVAAALGIALSGQLYAADTFTGLSDLGGSFSLAYGVSANGSVVVGVSNLAGGAQRAFRWDGAMTNLGTLGGTYSEALGISGDGNVIVGASTAADTNLYSFRWVGGAMTPLPNLPGGNYSRAYGASYDGSVVVGQADAGGGNFHAFRWVGGVTTDLGTLGVGSSIAFGVSDYGNVVVGSSDSQATQHAFRWVQGATNGVAGNVQMQALASLDGNPLTFTSASGVSGDGNVVVGSSKTNVGGPLHATRWAGAGMPITDLGTLGGTNSYATAASSDGSVIVGSSTDGGGADRAFRWTQAGNMQSVTSWLAGAGVSLPAGWAPLAANGVNGNGNVVVGYGIDPSGHGQAWLARVGGAGTGLITDINAFNTSLAEAGSSTSWQWPGVWYGVVYSGGHHRTLLDNGLVRTTADGGCAWATADAGGQNSSDTHVEMAEVGACKDIGSARLGLGVGQAWAHQNWSLGGNGKFDGQYLIGEVDYAFNESLEGSLLGMYGHFDTRLNRRYMNGAAVDISSAKPDATTSALRLRLDWKNAAQLAAFSLSPYASYLWAKTRVDSYTETGGGFPAAFDATTWQSNDVRIGAAGKTALSDATDLKLSLEGVHRFEDNGSGSSGQVIGLWSFSVPGQSLKQDWARAIVDLDYRLSKTSLLTVSASGATPGGDVSWGVSVGYRAAF